MKLCENCFFMASHPNGTNINENAGSTHIEYLQQFVIQNGLDIGFAFDGDADRCLMIDEHGDEIDGDRIVGALAAYMQDEGKLHGGARCQVYEGKGQAGRHQGCHHHNVQLWSL